MYRQLLYPAAAAFLWSACWFRSPHRTGSVPPSREEHTAFNTIQRSDSAVAFLLRTGAPDSSSTPTYLDYALAAPPRILDAGEVQQLMAIFRHRTFADTVIYSCAFLPDIGFKIIEYQNETNVLVAFYCNEWMMVRDSMVEIASCAHVRPELQQLSKRLFPRAFK